MRKNETEHYIELEHSEQRIRAKTAWNSDTLRGDYCDVLILDEGQLMNEETWDRVGAPMLLDNDGDAVFIYTPPSLHSRSASKARDPQHAAKLFKRAQEDTTGRWATFHFKSADNPYISEEALAEISSDMTALAYRQEILAEDVDEAPGALWTRANIELGRVVNMPDWILLSSVLILPQRQPATRRALSRLARQAVNYTCSKITPCKAPRQRGHRRRWQLTTGIGLIAS